MVPIRKEAEKVVKDLFDAYMAAPDAMPADWRAGITGNETSAFARQIADFLAGMTDNYAMREHRRLFDHTPNLA